MLVKPISEEANAARAQAQREGRVKKMERGLTRSQREAYRRWQGACERMDVPVTTETRLEFLSDLKEDVTS